MKSRPLDTIDDISKMIDAHYRFLLRHQVYLNKLELETTKTGSLSEDAIAYFSDVLNMTQFTVATMQEKLLPTVKVSLAEKIETIKKLVLLLRNTNRDYALSMLELQLQIQCHEASHAKWVRKAAQVSLVEKAETAFFDGFFYKHLAQHVQPILPAQHQELLKIIKIIPYEKVVTCKGHEEGREYRSDIVFNWEGFAKSMLQIFKDGTRLGRKDEYKEAENILKQMQTESPVGMEEMQQLFQEAMTLIKHRLQLNKQQKTTPKEKAKMLSDNVEFFYSVYPKVEHVIPVSMTLNKNMEDAYKAYHYYNKSRDTIRNEAALLQKQYDRLYGLFASYRSMSNAETLEVGLATIKQALLQLNAFWPDKAPEGLFTCSAMEDRVLASHATIESILVKLTDVEKQLGDLKEQLANQKQQQEAVTQADKNASEKEHQRFLAERRAATEKYKADILRKRAEREASKQDKNTNTPSADLTPSPVLIPDISVLNRLEALGHNQHLFLLDLLQLKKGITYHEVFHFIVNQLRGEIIEIGNGSSHKRIKLEKCYYEMLTTADNEARPAPATGGFFKPHGGEHNAGVMSRFNLELVKDVLEKAGITQAIVTALIAGHSPLLPPNAP